jgi:hypothetical protein
MSPTSLTTALAQFAGTEISCFGINPLSHRTFAVRGRLIEIQPRTDPHDRFSVIFSLTVIRHRSILPETFLMDRHCLLVPGLNSTSTADETMVGLEDPKQQFILLVDGLLYLAASLPAIASLVEANRNPHFTSHDRLFAVSYTVEDGALTGRFLEPAFPKAPSTHSSVLLLRAAAGY